jgi:hypothetical protein
VSGILLFRQEALNKLSAPEELDAAVRLVTPARWLATAALVTLAGTILLWALFGVTYHTVDGIGVIQRADSGRVARVWIPAAQALSVHSGQQATVRLAGLNGALHGRVIAVAETPTSAAQLADLERDDPALRALHAAGQVVGVSIELLTTPKMSRSFDGYSVHASLIGAPMHPIETLFPRHPTAADAPE